VNFIKQLWQSQTSHWHQHTTYLIIIVSPFDESYKTLSQRLRQGFGAERASSDFRGTKFFPFPRCSLAELDIDEIWQIGKAGALPNICVSAEFFCATMQDRFY
jgi:hypothetical protein